SYTYDTLQSFSRKKPEAHFFLIMGEDAYRDFDGWRNSLKIREIASILVASRPGQKKASGSEDSPGVFRVKMPECGASSRSIRSRIRQKTTEGLEIHPAVLGYILEHKLYGS
ncbi:MAG: hypothetical protein FGM27_06820, partial [Candidatus Omnitrophica bacterium]|nr:hypothetical protein [Candidatus Omnitrophota bacterium]